MIDTNNPLARAKRAIEMLDTMFYGYTIQAAVTEALQDIMHLEDVRPEKLNLIGALDDARNQHEVIAQPSVQDSGNVVSFAQASFEHAHKTEPENIA